MATIRNIEDMRGYVMDAYPSMNWKRKVSDMSDPQVVAVYHSLLGRKKKEEPKKEEPKFRQMTIFDYI